METEPSGYFSKRDWYCDTQSLVIIGDQVGKPPLAEVYRGALTWALTIMRTPEVLGKHSGLAAWQAWANQLVQDDEIVDCEVDLLRQRHFVHHAMVGNTAECRAWGGQFLEQAARDNPAAAAELSAAAEAFSAIHDLMWKVWGLEGGMSNPDGYLEFAKPEVRRKAAEILLHAAAGAAQSRSRLSSATRTGNDDWRDRMGRLPP